ncbi:MAG TPA: hypothetical protein VF676_04465 [Flavobacterium sp.]
MGDNVTFDPNNESFVLCEGTSFLNEVYNPYTANIQWYRNDEPIEGYQITSAGTYYVTAGPEFCPNETSTSLPIVVTIDTECNPGIDPHQATDVSIYPNPATDIVRIDAELRRSTQHCIL